MCRRSIITLLAVMTLLGSQSISSLGQTPVLPDDRSVRYNIRETPDDPDSQVIWTIILTLTAQQADDNSVAWLVETVTLNRLDATGEIEARWTDNSPEVLSSDGLWWIEHADPEGPALSEFTLPPLVTRVATVELGDDDDLEYTIEGVPNDPPEPLQEYVTGGLDLYFIFVWHVFPELFGVEEPVVIDDSEDPVMG